MAAQIAGHDERRSLPGFWISMLTILLPVILMLVGSWADAVSAPGSALNNGLRLVGNDDLALLIGALVSFVTLGTMRGFSRETILRFSNECLAPTATITLLVGAGGGFGRVLLDSGVSGAIIVAAMQSHVPLLLLAWLLAALMRLATGSSTVAMTTAAGIVAPIALHSTGVHPELLAIATGAGSLIFSHVNDGGFWLVKEYFNMSVGQTIKTWSICETIISVTALGLTAASGMPFDKSDKEICINTKILKWKLVRDEWNDIQNHLADLVASKFSEEHSSACGRTVRLRSSSPEPFTCISKTGKTLAYVGTYTSAVDGDAHGEGIYLLEMNPPMASYRNRPSLQRRQILHGSAFILRESISMRSTKLRILTALTAPSAHSPSTRPTAV